MKPKLILLVGPPGSGKSSLAHAMCQLADQANEASIIYINQDSQGKDGHFELFTKALLKFQPIIVDRMNFNKEQRNRYLSVAKAYGYETEIIVLHVSFEECLARCTLRKDHETIKDEATAKKAISMFFSKYERVQDDEADLVERRWPEGEKLDAIYCDLDGTLCDTSWRQHHVQPPEGQKKNWPAFFDGIAKDPVNEPVMQCLCVMNNYYDIVYCSGRNNKYKEASQNWLDFNGAPAGNLYMRQDNDSRPDFIVKEILLDFEVLTRYNILFCLDDRNQVVEMLRRRGLTVFQVAPGDF